MLPVEWAVVVNGRPVTASINDFIKSIECTDKEGETADTATLVFDDNDGQCMMPEKGSTIQIQLEGALVFDGFVDAVESIGARGSGMELNVTCTSHDKRSKVKERLGLHKDDATLEAFLSEAAKAAGLDGVKVDPELAKKKRPYWSTGGRSFLQLGRELAEEFGATFKVRGKRAVFAKRGNGSTPGGGSMPSVRAVRNVNLINWRITPVESKPRFAKARMRFYDRAEAKWEEEEVEIGTAPGAPEAADIGGAARSDKGAAKDAAGGAKTGSEREGGSGDVEILLDVSAWAEGTCNVEIRPGIDGPYRIASRTHTVHRDNGSATRLSLKQPGDGTGSDKRKSGSSGSGTSGGITGRNQDAGLGGGAVVA